METARKHWPILGRLGTDLTNRVREFMVIGKDGNGVIVATEDGLAIWFGEMKFGEIESRITTKPTSLDITDLVQMAQNKTDILLLNKRGEIYTMGVNDCGLGQLDLGIKCHFSPQLIPGPNKFISVRCGGGHSLALTDDGKVWAWGSNDRGQVGLPNSSTRSIRFPHQISELNSHRIVAVECGGSHSLALTDRGVVYAWGENLSGQLGDDESVNIFRNLSIDSLEWQHTPTPVPTPSPVQSMAAGSRHTLLLTKTGEVWACGNNRCGQLGVPITTVCSDSLVKVEGLPPISQIASHPATELSIAMSSDKRCFVWGQLNDKIFNKMNKFISVSTPRELPPFYSTVESPHSFYSLYCNTPHSVSIPVTLPSPLSTKMSRMFDNPETSPDVQFVVEQRTIHAHRCILSNFSDYFARMFSERWLAPVDPEDPIIKVTIPDHSYEAFFIFLLFFYTYSFEVHINFLPELFELASQYLVPYLQQRCISRMRTTLTPTTCCLYYPLTHRHSLLPELATFQQELVQFASTRMSEVVHSAAYQSMEPDLRDILTNAVQNLLLT